MEFSKTYNRDEFLNFLRRDFLPDDFSQVNEPVVFATKTTYSKQATKLGICKSLDLVVYEIKHSGKDDPRVGLSKEAFRMLSEEWQSRALVLFVPETNANNYRFSLIEIKLEGDQTSAKVHRKYSNPRRYSYLLGEGIGGYTPNKYLAKGKIRENDVKDLLERFSVEVLTKAFYNELSDWYAWAIDSVEFPGEQLMDTEDRRTEHRSKNVIRLLTRLLFVWFLKQKNLIPWQLFDEDYLNANLLKDFAPNLKIGLFKEKSQESRYYRAILQNLFFATLNCPITPQSKEDSRERGFRKSDWYGQGFGEDHLMRYESEFTNAKHFLELVNERVPFLNGGLFDCLDDKQNKTYIDGFSDNLPKPNRLKVPDFLFFGESQGKGQDISAFYGDKKKKSTDILGLVDILKKYNFTIEENMPFDQEISLDPELLGKVFENLLASYNPETKTTARKQTGSFYTPREIVQYMVDESLVAHLKRTVGEDLEEEYRKLMRYTDEEIMLDDDKRQAIIQSLQNCKVLDPACGSGAFPVGVLQQMVHILSQLDPNNELWKNLILDYAVKELSSTLKECTTEERDEIQADINRNFDDNVNRPDYARKLYLIENCIYGVDIQSIAVQISKLRFFISLVVDQKPTPDRNDNFGIRPLPNLEAKFAAANTLIGLKKEKTLFDNREIDKLQNKLVQASHRIFGAKSNKMKNKYKARVEELQFQIAEKLEMLGVVGNEDARLMREWKMFDQNVSSPFFDPEWMFGVSNGFDIVIANPPYIEFKKLDINIKKSISSYIATKGKYDLYVAFIEKSNNFLAMGGIHSFINPTTFLNRDYGQSLRKFIRENFKIVSIVDFADCQVFENATTYTGVFILEKTDSFKEYIFSVIKFKSGHHKIDKIDSFSKINNGFKDCFQINSFALSNDEWNFSPPHKELILNKLISNKQYVLKDITDYIFVGIQSGKDEVFFLNEDIIKSYNLEKDILHPILKGKDVNRYSFDWSGTYIIYPYDIENNLIPEKELSTQYPNIYSYLVSQKSILSGREYFDKSNKEWYELWCERKIKKFKELKIINSEIANYNKFTIDESGFLSNTKVFSTVLKSEFRKYYYGILGILNSKLLDYYHKSIASPKAGGAYEYKTQFIEKYPIIFDEHIYVKIGNIVRYLLKDGANAGLENEIDLMVYKLYGLTYDEVLTIDPKTPITQQQYEQ